MRLNFTLVWAAVVAGSLPAAEPCRVLVVDAENRWPVPLVELRTTDHQRFVSDNAGVIAIDAPDLQNHEVWFEVIGHGYGVKKDGFGYAGVRLTPVPGKTLTVPVVRGNRAKRLGRLTGAGLFAEAQKCGDEKDWRDSPVVGCDSVQSAVLGDKRIWLWGDTTLARYPLGIFDASAATTPRDPAWTLEPPLRPAFEYFRDGQGRPRGVARMPGRGPTWIFGMTPLEDATGTSRLVGTYMKIENHLDVYEYGQCVWNGSTGSFEKLGTIWTKGQGAKPAALPLGHPARWTDSRGKKWLLFGNPFPSFQCPDSYEGWQDRKQWQALEPPVRLTARDGTPVVPHSGSIGWHPWRRKWVVIFTEKFGKSSAFGEVYYAEADAPRGPWGKAVPVLTHANYTFYNPRLHVDLTPKDSPALLFEGTYTAEFAKSPPPTPRHNYNQILYRLDLDDPGLVPEK